jgi:hypothetical protein
MGGILGRTPQLELSAEEAALDASYSALARAVVTQGVGATPQLRDAAALAARTHGADCLLIAALRLKAAEQSVHPNARGAPLPRWRAGLEDWAAGNAVLLTRASAAAPLTHESAFYVSWVKGVNAARGTPFTSAEAKSAARLADALHHCLRAQAAYVALILLNPGLFGVSGFSAAAQRDALEAAVLAAVQGAGAAAAGLPVGPEELQLAAAMPHIARSRGSLRPAFASALVTDWERVATPGLRRRGLPSNFPLHLL